MQSNAYRPVFAVGGTVVLAPRSQRLNIYTGDLSAGVPYRLVRFSPGCDRVGIMTPQGERIYPICAFTPASFKFAVGDAVKVFNSRMNIYSCPMKITGVSAKGYWLSNGCCYDVKVLKRPDEVCDSFVNPASKENVTQTSLAL